jgi:small subunit ribosomal protein S6
VFPPAQAREADSDRGKRNEGTVNEYEILLMLDPELAEERQTEIVTRTKELVERGSGSWLSHDVWGRRRLAYEIDHKTDGAYHLLQFDVEPTTLDEIARVLKITDGVMRHMATRRVKGGGTRTAPPPLPPSEAAPVRYEREPAPAPVVVDEAAEETEAPVEEPETDVAVAEAEEYAEPTESEESEAPETAPEEEA